MRKSNVIFIVFALIFLLGFVGGIETGENIAAPLAGAVICLLILAFSSLMEKSDDFDDDEEDGEE